MSWVAEAAGIWADLSRVTHSLVPISTIATVYHTHDSWLNGIDMVEKQRAVAVESARVVRLS